MEKVMSFYSHSGKLHGEGKFTSNMHMYERSTKSAKSQPNLMRRTKIESTNKAVKSERQGEKDPPTTMKNTASALVKQGPNPTKEQGDQAR